MLNRVEECDDGNLVSGDGCTAQCQLEVCGDGIVNNAGTEECDDGNTNDDDACGNDCKRPLCGDGELQGAEQCEAPFSANCNPFTCQNQCVCGDGILCGSEDCDPAPAGSLPTLLCDSNCTHIDPLKACVECLDVELDEAFGLSLNADCQADFECKEIFDCVVFSGCANASPSDCYCGGGVDVNLCYNNSYVATGSCVNEIRGAFPPPSTNADILDRMAIPEDTAVGDAFNIIINSRILNLCPGPLATGCNY
jgi:cysteine-rich repeat protein